MAETADSVVVEIQARTGNFDTQITQSARAFDQSMSAVERSATQAESAVRTSADRVVQSHQRMGASGMMLEHVMRATSDQVAAGAPLMQILAMHVSQVGEAAALSGESMGAFGRVMSGPWGIAIQGGIVALTMLIGKMLQHHDAVDQELHTLVEHAHNTDETRVAQESFGRTIPGITEAIRTETAALEDQNRSLAENQRLALSNAQGNLQRLQQLQGPTERDLAQARRALADARSAAGAGSMQTMGVGGSGLDPTVSIAAQRVASLEQKLAAINRGIAGAQQEARDAQVPIAQRQAEAIADPIARITQHYEDLADAARLAAHDNDQLTASLARTLGSINLRRDAELDAYRESQRNQRAERDLVRPVTGPILSPYHADRSMVPLNGRLIPGRVHEGIDLRAAVGTPVVAPEAGIARVLNAPGGLGLYVEIRADSGARDLLGHLSAANIRSGDRVTAGQIVALSGDSGNARGGTPHLHWQRQVNGQWVNPMLSVGAGATGDASAAAQAAHQAAELATRRQHDEAHFQEELAGLNTDILNARRHQVQTEQESADSDVAAIRAEQDQRDQRIRDEAAERTRRDASQTVAANIEAGILLARSAELAQAKVDARRALEQQRLDEQRIEIAQSELHDQESVLQARAQLARTAMERRDIELRLLDLQHQEELLAIQKQRAQQNLSPKQRAQLDRDEAASNARYGYARQNTIRQTAGPLEAFINGIPQGAQAINEALQTVATDGLQALNDGLGQAVSRFLHLGGVAGQVLNTIINDMIRLVLQQAELAAFGGGKGGGGGFGGFLSSIASMVGLGGGGGGGGSFGDAIASDMKFAGGGVMDIGGNPGIDNNTLSINGKRVAKVGMGEKLAIIPQGKALGYNPGGAAAPGHAGGALTVNVRVDAKDAVLTDTVQGWVAHGVRAGVEASANYTNRSLRTLLKKPLNG